MSNELPADVRRAALEWTRRARAATDSHLAAEHRQRRENLLAAHGYEARVREENTREILVLYPTEWVHEEAVRPDVVEDINRAVEIPLAGTGTPENWEVIDSHNRAIVEAVREQYGDVHAKNTAAFAEFMSNHYAKRLELATPAEREEFLDEYFPRNAWPSAEQADLIEESLAVAVDVAQNMPDSPVQ